MRPAAVDGLVGQEQVVGPGTVLREAIERDRLGSFIFWGPPGSGKTTLALIIANSTQAHFVQLSAVSAGVADVRKVIGEARERLAAGRGRTVLFIDEIHRFNKAQQDALLPAVEEGAVFLIGATTENPYFSVVDALVSRCRVFRLEALSDDNVRSLLTRALGDEERGLGGQGVEVSAEALDHLVNMANGDARSALNALELASQVTSRGPDGRRVITLDVAVDAIQRRALRYDRQADGHYDTISAFIKSMRASDPDAAVYYLARMIEAGEDPMFVARRIVIFTAEDVGNADPEALRVAVAAAQATAMIGLPEARIILAQAAIYAASAPKSRSSCDAIDAALRDVRDRRDHGVPLHLRNVPHPGLSAHGYGRRQGPVLSQMPTEMAGTVYYRPTESGREKDIARRLEQWKQLTKQDDDDTIPAEPKV
jgi:putative ATPase